MSSIESQEFRLVNNDSVNGSDSVKLIELTNYEIQDTTKPKLLKRRGKK